MHNSMASVAALSRKLRCWLFGHNHDSLDLVRDDARFTAHQRGSQYGSGSQHARDRRDHRPLGIPLLKRQGVTEARGK